MIYILIAITCSKPTISNSNINGKLLPFKFKVFVSIACETGFFVRSKLVKLEILKSFSQVI